MMITKYRENNNKIENTTSWIKVNVIILGLKSQTQYHLPFGMICLQCLFETFGGLIFCRNLNVFILKHIVFKFYIFTTSLFCCLVETSVIFIYYVQLYIKYLQH